MSITCHNRKYKCWEPSIKKKKNIKVYGKGTFEGDYDISLPVPLQYKGNFSNYVKNIDGLLFNNTNKTIILNIEQQFTTDLNVTAYLIC